MHTKTLSLILAALLLASSLSINTFAEDEGTTEPTESVETETTETTESPETTEPEITAPETTVPETTPPETTAPETTAPETTAPETTPPETEPEKEEQTYKITVMQPPREQGMVVASRRTAKEGDVIILNAFGNEYEKNGKQYKSELQYWYSNADIYPIRINQTTAFFYMPDEDVKIYPVFKTVDITEYYDWDSVEKQVDKLHRNESLDIDMEDETVIPRSVLAALSGKDADVTFTTADCIYTINGEDITMNKDSDGGYALTYEDYTLSKLEKRIIRNSDVVSIKVEVESEHDVVAELRCFASKNLTSGYLYRLENYKPIFVSEVKIKNGEAIIPVSVDGTYIVTQSALADVSMTLSAASANTIAIVGGKIEPLCIVENGQIYFKPDTYGKVMVSEYTNPYTDVRNHKYKSQIDFVAARGVIDGVSANSFQPNAGITAGEFMRSIARLRGIPDKDAYDYCVQLDIFTYEYVEDALLTRNEMSVIFTNFINHLIEYPKSFGAYSMEGFDGNAAAWVGNRFRELKKNSPVDYDWKEYATRAEAAYLLEAAVRTVVMGK